MSTRRRYTGEFNVKVTWAAVRGDKMVQEIVTRHKVHPNQVNAGRQHAAEGLSDVFSKRAERSRGGTMRGRSETCTRRSGNCRWSGFFEPKGSSVVSIKVLIILLERVSLLQIEDSEGGGDAGSGSSGIVEGRAEETGGVGVGPEHAGTVAGEGEDGADGGGG